ncbi:E4 SUMO-protein ligase PIAL2-like isoform X2 [Cynara cardunculus var. scolymus]|uniref:E4 SUMO-protein ligase PIAL2-like isoform X2 n=1 Tax=Cynara cardunculus var. scolymus TaxID=59895 RepID=UPI000D62B726|nr:E4 SUMO-protein ligase PIAL2-like isoform X2 [Cynara cardunculus var. scolymus]
MADIYMTAAAAATVKRRIAYLNVSSTKLVEESIDQASTYIQTGDIDNSGVYSQTCMNLGSTIDSAVALNEVPSSSHLLQLLLIVKEVYRRRTELLQPSLMLLMLPIKAACQIGWFPDEDKDDLLMMAKEVSYGFSDTDKMNIEPSDAHSYVSNITSRFYPKMEVEKILASFDVEAGYGTFVADFHISKGTLPRHCRDLWLLVARMDNMETAACIASPSNVDFLVNGSGVPGRTKRDMVKGPQLPSNLTKMIKYGVNLLQVLGDFDGRYIIVIAFMSMVSSPDPPQLQDYVHPMESEVDSECLVIEMSSRISLHCPFSQHRIKIPVKGRLCKHPQCFDYKNFMEINSRRPTWKCPVCSKPICNLDIRIDQDFVKILNEVAEDVSDVIMSADGSWTIMATEIPTTESNRNTMTQNNHVLDVTEYLTHEEPNDTLPNSSFTLHNSSVSAIGMSAECPSALWQLSVTRDAASPAQIQQLGDSRLQSQGLCNIIHTPPVQQTTHHMNPINSTTTQATYGSTNPYHPSAETQQQVQTDRTTQATNSFTPSQLAQSAANSPHSVALALEQWHRRVFGQSQPPPTTRPPSTTSLPGDPMPLGRMRGSLKGKELAVAQESLLAPPRQPARADKPWSRPPPTPLMELLMQRPPNNSESTPNGSNFR